MSLVHLSRAARWWQEIVNDSELLQRPERIETDARGQVMIAPTPDFIHSGFPESWLVELEGCSRPAALQINIL